VGSPSSALLKYDKPMKFSSLPLAQTISQLCLAKDIRHIVICPGSRNAPLTISFTENEAFTTYSIVDERCAAFFALGMAQQLRQPVAVLCTSGSAVLNFYPAVAEAFYSDVPLVVISADRPADKIDIGDGQTIRQENVFANHILYSANLRIEEEQQVFNETQINVALNAAIELNGPVHINAPFEEPLYVTQDDLTVRPQHVPARRLSKVLTQDLEQEAKLWNTAAKKLVLVGVLPPDSLAEEWISFLGNCQDVLVLTETTSNLHHPNFISCIDQLITTLSEEEFEALQPNVLLTLGGMVVSKRVKAFLRKFQPKAHWHVDEKKAYDTYECLTEHFKVRPNSFFEKFIPQVEPKESIYQSKWLALKGYRERKHGDYLAQIPFSDLKVFESIFGNLPMHTVAHISNSAAIRYAQLFQIDKRIAVYCNRGTSGIDGSTSTALGHAVISEKQNILITGDLSFFYDSNALWNQYIPNNFRIVVVNNNGGGIFRILPGNKNTPNFDTYFETTHQLTAKQLCEMYGFGYNVAAEEKELASAWANFYLDSAQPKLLEIFTDRLKNDEVLLQYFQFLK